MWWGTKHPEILEISWCLCLTKPLHHMPGILCPARISSRFGRSWKHILETCLLMVKFFIKIITKQQSIHFMNFSSTNIYFERSWKEYIDMAWEYMWIHSWKSKRIQIMRKTNPIPILTNQRQTKSPCDTNHKQTKWPCDISPALPILALWGWPSTEPDGPPSAASPSSRPPLVSEPPPAPGARWRQPEKADIEPELARCMCSAVADTGWQSHSTDPPARGDQSTDRDAQPCSPHRSGSSCGDLWSSLPKLLPPSTSALQTLAASPPEPLCRQVLCLWAPDLASPMDDDKIQVILLLVCRPASQFSHWNSEYWLKLGKIFF